MENDKKPKKNFLEVMNERGELADAIYDFLCGKSVQECIDILDAVKRRILEKTIV